MPLSKIEKILIILFFFSSWIVLAAYAGGPIFSDEFLYIDLGLEVFRNQAMATVTSMFICKNYS